ncbi:MAG: IS200/IS605 family transposase [Chloroflexota bacterium]
MLKVDRGRDHAIAQRHATNLAVSELVQRLKGRTSRLWLVEFGELNKQFWGKHLWARGYFAASSGNVTDEIIKQYIESQIESQAENLSPPEDGGNFSVGD